MEKYQADQSFQKQYEKYVKQVTPTHNLALQMLQSQTDWMMRQQEACARFCLFWRAYF